MRILLFLSFLALAGVVSAAPQWFDMGSRQSAVWPGCTRATAGDAWSDAAGFGWGTVEGLGELAQAHEAPVENASRGRTEPPPIWTNAITEDAVVGEKEAAFRLLAPAGDREVYLLCGTSDGRQRAQFFDFTVRVGDEERRVQIEGAHQFRALRFHAVAGAGPLEVRFTPRSKFVVCALLVWGPGEAERVAKEVIAPLEEWTFRLPPREWAKWKEEPEPPSGPMPELDEAARRRGFAVWSRHYLECVYPRTHPRAEELDPTLRVFASPGEREPLNFIVRPAAPLRDAKVVVSDIGPVPADQIEVRRVRYLRARPNYTVADRFRVVPDVLERFAGGDLPAEENTRFWITLRVPETAAPGLYEGRVVFRCAGGEAVVPVALRILPIALREDPAKLFGIYYHHPLDRAAEAKDEVSRDYWRRKADLEHADMAAHGTRNVMLSFWCRPADRDGRFELRWPLLEEKAALWRKHRFAGPMVMGFNADGIYEKHMKERHGSHLRGVKDPPQAFSDEVTALVREIESGRKERGLPEFLYYPVDEPGTEPAAVGYMEKVLRACKAAGVRTYVTADPTREQFAPLRPLVDVWSTQPFAPDRETVLADMGKRRVEYWCYPNHVAGENDHTPVAGARMTYGFGIWRSGFVALNPWIYQSNSGDPWNYLDGPHMDFFNRSEPDGAPVPVALWEAYREGWDDHRYLFTLEQLVAEARRSGRPEAEKAAAEAAAELGRIESAIRVQEKYKHDDLWAPEEFDARRWLVARQILRVQESLGGGR